MHGGRKYPEQTDKIFTGNKPTGPVDATLGSLVSPHASLAGESGINDLPYALEVEI
jgi:hypothetical protein